MIERANAAAELHRIVSCLEDRFDGIAIGRMSREGAVEIDHMQPFETLIFEGSRLGGRIGVVDRRLLHVAELQADALAAFQVDRGKKDHVVLRP